jgi:hypothetical protein
MPAECPRHRRFAVALFGLIGCVLPWLPGCASNRDLGPDRDTTRVAQRPTYPIEGTRPLYLGGYAGANYDPATRPSR